MRLHCWPANCSEKKLGLQRIAHLEHNNAELQQKATTAEARTGSFRRRQTRIGKQKHGLDRRNNQLQRQVYEYEEQKGNWQQGMEALQVTFSLVPSVFCPFISTSQQTRTNLVTLATYNIATPYCYMADVAQRRRVMQVRLEQEEAQQQATATQLQDSQHQVARLQQELRTHNGSFQDLLNSFPQQRALVQTQTQSFQKLLINHLQQQEVRVSCCSRQCNAGHDTFKMHDCKADWQLLQSYFH